MRNILLLALALAGCTQSVVVPPKPDYCEPPSDSAFTCEGDSSFWGPAPNSYASMSDGTEWHLGYGMRTRYRLTDGTMHTPERVLCIVASDGTIAYEADSNDRR